MTAEQIEFVWYLALIVPTLYVGIFLHEAGHYLAALAVGAYIEEVQVLGGRPLASRRWGDTRFNVGWKPQEGHVMAAFPPPGVRVRCAVTVAAGPAVNVALGAVALLTAGPLSDALMFTSVVLVGFALWPVGISDGARLWRLARGATVEQEAERGQSDACG
jgi:membrane-associated protease RseP (regulator of RpoE activity)